MWQSLFETIGKAFDFFGRLLSRKQAEPAEPIEQPEDPDTARSGTAAGAAAHEASHIAGPPKAS